MFELVETSAELRNRKRWSALLSYGIEATAVTLLLAFPLLHTDKLVLVPYHLLPPHARYVPDRAPAPATPPPSHPQLRQAVVINPLLPPREIPRTIDMRPDPTPPSIGSDQACPGCVPIPGARDGVFAPGLESPLHPATPLPAHPRTAPVLRPSSSQESLLIRQVKPVYPRLAIESHTQGTVLLQAIIARDGTITNLKVISGHPLLVRAAADAVMQWRYRPYILDGEPVEVETQVTVHFTLNAQ